MVNYKLAILLFIAFCNGNDLWAQKPDCPKQDSVKHNKLHAMTETVTGIHRKIEFENDQVRVVRYQFAPHAKIPMHQAPDLVGIWLTDGHLKLTFPNGKTEVQIHKAGDVGWGSAQQHAGENVGSTPLEFIAVQLKSSNKKK
jgi:quercetin dioxygenase-like cupin family protein